MRCENQLNYLKKVVRDYAATLPESASIATQQLAALALDVIEADLNKPLAKAPKPPAAIQKPEN